MEVTLGRIVLYKLSSDDAAQINRRRTTGSSIAERIKNNNLPEAMGEPESERDSFQFRQKWPLGAQAHIGNSVSEGDVFPMMVTKVWQPGYVNGQVFLDGNDCFWATSVIEGNDERQWSWPPRV